MTTDYQTSCLNPVMTHSEIATLMGVTRSRVHQIEERALAKLRVLILKAGFTFDGLVNKGEKRVRVKARR